jgi:regulator of RNase E activity RraA
VYCGSRAAPASVAELYAVEVQVPVGCGGVAIFPGDIIAGDKDGVIVIPRNLAEEIAEDAPEQERYERYVLSRVQAGDSITGLYPSTEESRKRYQDWEG